jgi:hypothetical protein
MERQVCAEEDYTGLQEDHSSQADECSYAEEIVGDDEGAVGRAEDQGLGPATCVFTPYGQKSRTL